MGFMEKLGATLATKYGVVTDGKHKDCQVAMGNDPQKKVETSYSFSQIIFVEGNEEKGRYDITGLIMAVRGQNEKGVQLRVYYNQDEYSDIDLQFAAPENVALKLLKTFGGAKSGPQTPEQKFHNILVFFRNTFACMRSQDIDFFENYFGSNGVLDDLTEKLIKIYRDTAVKKEQA